MPCQSLILFAHPYPHQSKVNAPLLAAVRDLPGVAVQDLYERYPDFYIDVEREQALLQAHDLIIMQYPFYWYSVPALLKHWQEQVLEEGFAYGPGSMALRDKALLAVISTGHSEKAYSREGHDHYSLDELCRPLERTARHCGMRWRPPFVTHSSGRLDSAAIQERSQAYRTRLTEEIQAWKGIRGSGPAI